MNRSLKAFFLSRQQREMWLLVALIGGAAVIWFSSLISRGTVFWRDERTVSTALKGQQQWIDRRDSIKSSIEGALKQLEPGKTYSATALQTSISNIAREAGIATPGVRAENAKTSAQFTVNTCSVSVNGATWETLRNFMLGLQKYAPYLRIEDQSFSLTPSRGNPAMLTASFKVSSVEFKR